MQKYNGLRFYKQLQTNMHIMLIWCSSSQPQCSYHTIFVNVEFIVVLGTPTLLFLSLTHIEKSHQPNVLDVICTCHAFPRGNY